MILNALRGVARRPVAPTDPAPDVAMARRFVAEHRTLRPGLDRLRAAADHARLAPGRGGHRRGPRAPTGFLVDEIGPHEDAEGAELYPVLDRGSAARTDRHDEPSPRRDRPAHPPARRCWTARPRPPDADDVLELRRLLYGLHAILRLHFAQEEEGYFSLLDEAGAVGRRDEGPGPRHRPALVGPGTTGFDGGGEGGR